MRRRLVEQQRQLEEFRALARRAEECAARASEAERRLAEQRAACAEQRAELLALRSFKANREKMSDLSAHPAWASGGSAPEHTLQLRLPLERRFESGDVLRAGVSPLARGAPPARDASRRAPGPRGAPPDGAVP
ncbi:hypothetical protein [Streptomyces boncukensis]|uniref:Uncharacterized protein n=1 Tax=Streptomyces boncukensis TaxID=2711219 RepID=A0A6G4X4R0_9ACTN|nr:hypothetical protein [Streptomyces boncukensis]NGO71651.1 hypothetical protein [Streptomyces boncukensis]